MTIDTISSETENVDHTSPAAQGSALAGLRKRREEIVAAATFDLQVPRYEDPEVFVRFRPLALTELQSVAKRAEASKDPEADLIANASLIAHACVGIFQVVEGREVSVLGEGKAWPKFGDEEMFNEFEITTMNTSDVVRQLYATDGDLISTASKLAELSGYAADQAQRDLAGN